MAREDYHTGFGSYNTTRELWVGTVFAGVSMTDDPVTNGSKASLGRFQQIHRVMRHTAMYVYIYT